MMKKALMSMGIILCLGLGLAPVAQAHPYLYYGPTDDAGNTLETLPPAGFTPWPNLYDVMGKFDIYVGGLMTPTTGTTTGCNLWVATDCGGTANTPIWSTVKGQEGPTWLATSNGTDGAPNWNYTGAGSDDDARFQMLDKILDTNYTCYTSVAQERLDAIRSAFAANTTHVLDQELTMNNVRVRASALGGSADSTQTITTGGMTGSIAFKIFGATVYTVPPQQIPNLWKTKGSLLRSANEYFRDAAVNMTGAYMTLADPLVTNYVYAFMGTIGVTALNQMLPTLLSGIGKADALDLTAPDLGTAFKLALGAAMSQITIDREAKAATACAPWGTINDLDVTVPVTVDTIGTINIRITCSGGDLCNSIKNFAAKFSASNGFTNLSQYLATDGIGDLNGDGTTNLQSYTAAAGDVPGYLSREGLRCGVNAPNVVGLAQEAAAAAITGAGLVVGTLTSQCSDTVAAGLVISQDPPADTVVNPGSAVSFIVSSGPCPIPITGSILINNNRSATNNRNVTLTLTWGGGSGTGVVRMRFSDNGSTWTAWQPLAATLAYTLPVGADGHRTVRVQYLDKLNNKSATFSDYILLDTVAPTGSIIINQGALSTKTLAVTLDLTWDDAGAKVSRMRFSDDGAHWTPWEPQTTPRAYTLPAGLGYHTVRVQFRDGADNISTAYNDYIKVIQ